MDTKKYQVKILTQFKTYLISLIPVLRGVDQNADDNLEEQRFSRNILMVERFDELPILMHSIYRSTCNRARTPHTIELQNKLYNELMQLCSIYMPSESYTDVASLVSLQPEPKVYINHDNVQPCCAVKDYGLIHLNPTDTSMPDLIDDEDSTSDIIADFNSPYGKDYKSYNHIPTDIKAELVKTNPLINKVATQELRINDDNIVKHLDPVYNQSVAIESDKIVFKQKLMDDAQFNEIMNMLSTIKHRKAPLHQTRRY